jgi:DNA-binding MarR family transcriptional regulator
MVKRGERLTDKTLTANEKILIHMKESSPLRDLMDAPYALTQHGISDSVGIRVNHVSRAMKTLSKDGYVEESTGRVRGEIRKRKVYSLTDRGTSKAKELRELLASKIVELHKDKMIKELTINAVIDRLGGVPTSAILRKVDSEGVVDISARRKTKKLVTLSRGLPRIGDFYGREGEMAVLEEWLSSRKEQVLSLAGAKGIGKSSLAMHAYEQWTSSMNTFWFTFQEWDTTDSFLEALSNFLKDMGRPELRDYLNSAKKIDMWEVSGWVERGLGDDDNILFLDEVVIVGKSMESLLNTLIESIGRTENTKMLITQDKRDIPDSRSFLARELLVEIDLLGLDKKSCEKLLAKKMDDSEFEKIYRLTEGNPLHIMLIENGKLEDLIDTKDYTPEELALLKYMKVIKETK